MSEAAALADVFVFRLMFRLYWLPDALKDFRPHSDRGPDVRALFYERKRLLGAFAARKTPVKTWRDGKPLKLTKYMCVSALALDTSPGACSALNGVECGIYDGRPLSCRSVPFHYSQPEATASEDLGAFVRTPGYGCDTSQQAKIVLTDRRIVDPETIAARREALSLACTDRPWAEAISRRIRAPSATDLGLPQLREIEANAEFAATTTSMRVAWQIAAEARLTTAEECDRLVALQLVAIDHALERSRCSVDVRGTLMDMKAEYSHHLQPRNGKITAV